MKVLLLLGSVAWALVSVPLTTIPPSESEWRGLQGAAKMREARGSTAAPKSPKSFHTVEATLGFPPKKFEMLIDLSLDGNWITSEQCESIGCYTREGYNSKESLLHKASDQTVHVAYGGGSGKGKLSTDTISIGGMHVVSFTFGELDSVKGGVFLRGPFDGVLGLAWSTVESNSNNIVSSLFARQLIEDNSFSVSFANKTGRLVLGGADPSLGQSGMTYHPLLSKYPWSVQLGEVRVEDSVLNDWQDLVGVLDLKVPVISGPLNFTSAINAAIGPIALNCSNIETLPHIVVTSALQDFSLGPEDYVVQLDTDAGHLCMSGVWGESADEEHVIKLGEAFIRKYYSHFDLANKRVGFALSA